MSLQPLHVVFSGGGTAGHLFPGLAVAAELRRLAPTTRITFAGADKPLEARHVAAAQLEHYSFPCAPAGRSPGALWRFLVDNYAGYRAARRFLRHQRTSVVVGLGGYASVPMSRAALSLGIPLVLLEQNVLPGKVTRWLAPRADLVCTAFETTRDYLQCVCPVRNTGNPLRAGFRPSGRKQLRRAYGRCRLLALGGSGGAASLNEHVPRALARVRGRLHGWHVVHQTGPNGLDAVRAHYAKIGIPATVVPFVRNVAQVLRRSDLAICRAGGTTLAELAATGLPALLVPYPHATDDHQLQNAEVFASAGAARIVDERSQIQPLSDSLALGVAELLSNGAQRQLMSDAMLRLARPEAAWQVARMVFGAARRRAPQRAA